MIIVKIDAGLGNQMLEYCFLRQLEDQFRNIEIKADLDRFEYKKFCPHHGYELTKVFDIPELNRATTKEILNCGGEYQRMRDGLFEGIKKYYYNNLKHRNLNTYRLHQKDWKDFLELNSSRIEKINCWIDDSWNYMYEPAISELRFRNTPQGKNRETAEKMEKCNSLSIHIRRGDYVGTSFDVLKGAYYKAALEFLQNQIPDLHIWFFSDDSQYVEKEYSNLCGNYEIVNWNKGNMSFWDMQLMSMCKYNIICNSTFSLWAAVLNQNPEKIVIKPDAIGDIMCNGGGEWYSLSNDGTTCRKVR